VLAGATSLAEALRPTLGPKSKCVLIERKGGSPRLEEDPGETRDIAREHPEVAARLAAVLVETRHESSGR
jgi:hypothetical protein